MFMITDHQLEVSKEAVREISPLYHAKRPRRKSRVYRHLRPWLFLFPMITLQKKTGYGCHDEETLSAFIWRKSKCVSDDAQCTPDRWTNDSQMYPTLRALKGRKHIDCPDATEKDGTMMARTTGDEREIGVLRETLSFHTTGGDRLSSWALWLVVGLDRVPAGTRFYQP